MNDVVEHKASHPIAQLRKDLKAALPTFGLKNEREQERMSSVLMVAVERDPDLVFADRQSLIAAVRQCANHGLVPDGNEATLQIYNSKVKVNGQDKWIKKVQYQPMIRGIVNRVLRSGKVESFWAETVYKGESFKIDTSLGDRRPVHDPDHFNRSDDDKDIVGFYAVAKMSNGTIDCEAMGLKDIAKVRSVAKTQKVWDGWFGEKGKVAVMRRLSKRLPLSAEDMDFIMNPQEHSFDNQVKDVTPKPEPNLAQRLAGATPDTEDAQEVEPDATEPHWTETASLDEALPGSESWAEGEVAHAAGTPRTECPHADNEARAADWLAAWDAAAEAAA